MKTHYIFVVAATALFLGASGPSFADNMQGGNGSTGNPGTNDPAATPAGMNNMKTMPRCTTKRTHNCHHASMKKKPMAKAM